VREAALESAGGQRESPVVAPLGPLRNGATATTALVSAGGRSGLDRVATDCHSRPATHTLYGLTTASISCIFSSPSRIRSSENANALTSSRSPATC
jgi:hypothetical protein